MLPMSLGGGLGDAILARAGYHELFIAGAAFSALGLAASWPLGESRRPSDGSPRRGVLTAVLDRDLLPLWATGLAFATALAAHFTFLKTFVLATGTGSVGLFFTAYSFAAIVLRVLFGSLPDRLGALRVLLPALVSLASGLFVLAFARTDAAIGVAGVLCGLGHGYVFPILLGLAVDRARESERGAALAVYTALFDAGTLLGGPVLGAIVRGFGYPAMYTFAGCLVLLGGAVFVVTDRPRVSGTSSRP